MTSRRASLLRAEPSRSFSHSFDLFRGSTQITHVEAAWFRERSTFELDGVVYELASAAILSSRYTMHENGQLLAEAKVNFFGTGCVIHSQGAEYRLQTPSCLGRKLKLMRGKIQVGSITPTSVFSQRCVAEFPESLSEPVQVFTVWLGMVLWRRDEANVATAT